MTGKIKIDPEKCKGCGLCVTACPKGGICISTESNRCGYFPAEKNEEPCNGCTICALVCPDAAIEVMREQREIVEIKSSKSVKSEMSEEKL